MANTLLMRAIGVLITLALVPTTAAAEITSVTVKTTRDYEGAVGYTYAEITIHGSVARTDGSVGVYAVPAVIIYPQRRGNRVGVVDWLNSAFYHFFPPIDDSRTVQFTLQATGDHLFEQGYTYLSIQWNKFVTQIFGPTAPASDRNHLVYGTIEKSADAWEILLDAARLLKDPSVYPGDRGPARVTTVLSSGYSQGAAAQLELIVEGLDPQRVYDGHLVQMIGLTCFKRQDDDPNFGFFGNCNPLPTDGSHAPVMTLVSETDMLIYPTAVGFGKSGFFLRNRFNPNWRQYEMAGIAHLPKPIIPVGPLNQSNADARPIFRAAFDNLARWARGDASHQPPPARFFRGDVDATDAFIPVRDPDDHFSGGLRLPHVVSRVSGDIAGAPLGRQTPCNPDCLQPPLDPFEFLGGTFTRFTDDELLGRYASRDDYVRRVERAADHLAGLHYITNADRKRLVAAARVEPLPPPLTSSRQ